MTVLITGAGLVAAHVGRALQARGQEIVLYDLAPSREYLSTVLDLDRAVLIEGDTNNLPELTALAQQHHARCIVHTAALIGTRVARQPYHGVQVNVVGTLAVAEAARLTGVGRIVYSSSMAVYDFERLPRGALIAEDAPLGPKNLYAATKLASEVLLEQYGDIYRIDVVRLRLAGVYGRGQYLGGSWMGRVVNRVLEAALAGQPVTIQPEWIGANEFVYVKDVAQAFAEAALSDRAVGGAYNIGSGVVHAFSEFVTALRAVLPELDLTVAAPDSPIVSYLVRDQPFDLAQARRVLGYAPRFSFESGLRDYLDELRAVRGTYPRLD